MCTRILQPNDKFLIFASDGLWEFLSNQEAVEIVYNNPRMVTPPYIPYIMYMLYALCFDLI